MKKLIIILMVVSIIGIGCSNGADLDNEVPEYTSISIEDIENDDIIAWYEESVKEHGYYTYQEDSKIYLLIAAGERPTGGYKVVLEEENLTDEKFSAIAILERPSEDDMVTMALTYPAVLLELSNVNNLEVDLDLSDLEKDVTQAGGFSQVLARYNGQIDNNSIEVDTTLSFQLQDYTFELALRLNESLIEEQTQIIEALELGDLILFNTYQDEHGRFILDEILDVGYENKTHHVKGMYLGRIDSNFIEVEVNTYPIVFMLHMDLEKELHGEIETEEIVDIQFTIGEHGHRIVKDIIVN